MPNAATVTINNGDADVVFSPDFVTGTHVQYQDLAEPNLSLRSKMHYDRPQNAGSQVRRTVRLNIPQAVTLKDNTVVVKEVTVKAEIVSPSDLPSSARRQARILLSNALVDAATAAIFDNPEWVW